MAHPYAILVPKGRLQAKCVVNERWTLQRAAERFHIAVTTAKLKRQDRPRAAPSAATSMNAPATWSNLDVEKQGRIRDGAGRKVSGRAEIDNGSCFRSHAFRDALGAIKQKGTAPYRPQIKGKVERVQPHHALGVGLRETLFLRSRACYSVPAWLHQYIHHRGHSSLKGQPPASCIPNHSGEYT